MLMGFPVPCSELLLPRVLLHIAFFLGEVRRVISWLFDAVGLGDLLDSDAPWPEASAASQEHHHHHHQYHRWGFRSVSMAFIDEALPVVRYAELDGSDGGHVGGSCAVCLYAFEADDDVRRLRNCRHVYHRGCLDPWLDHGQRTCPLCRTTLVGGGGEETARHYAGYHGSDSGTAWPDIFEEEDFMIEFTLSSSLASASAPQLSPAALLLPSELF